MVGVKTLVTCCDTLFFLGYLLGNMVLVKWLSSFLSNILFVTFVHYFALFVHTNLTPNTCIGPHFWDWVTILYTYQTPNIHSEVSIQSCFDQLARTPSLLFPINCHGKTQENIKLCLFVLVASEQMGTG